MLDFMRRQAKGWIAKVLFTLIVLSFVLWGVSGYFSGGGASAVARVGDDTITRGQLDKRVRLQRQRLQKLLGDRFSSERFDSKQMARMALNQMIRESLLEQEAHRLGLTATDTAVRQAIRSEPAFQQQDSFDPTVYRRTLEQAGLQPTEFESRIRQDLAVSKLQQFITQAPIISEQELWQAFRTKNEKRVAHYFRLEPAQFSEQVELDPEAVHNFYQNHLDRYQRPVRVRVRYVVLEPEAIMHRLEVDEAKLRSYFEANRERYTEPPKRQVSQILLRVAEPSGSQAMAKVRERAQELAAKARQGADFATLARKHSEGPGASKGGNLGWVKQQTLVEELGQTVFGMEPGEVSKPIKTASGFHILKLHGIRPERTPKLQEVRSQVVSDWRQQRSVDQVYEQLSTFKDLLYTRDTLEPVAEELGLEIRTSDWIPKEGELPTDIPQEEAFQEAVFATQEGTNSEAVELSDTRFAGLHVVEREAAQVRPLDKVRARVEQELRTKRAQELAKGAAQKAVAALSKGESLEGWAERFGVEVHSSEPVTRGQASSALPAGLVEPVFSAPRNEFQMARSSKGDYTVFRVAQIIEPERSALAKHEDQLRSSSQKRQGQARMRALYSHFQQQYRVRIFNLRRSD